MSQSDRSFRLATEPFDAFDGDASGSLYSVAVKHLAGKRLRQAGALGDVSKLMAYQHPVYRVALLSKVAVQRLPKVAVNCV